MAFNTKNTGIDEEIFTEILKANEECPFHNLLDVNIIELGEGEAILEIPIANKHLNPRGRGHGGVTLALADAAVGIAIRTLNHVVVTVEMNMNFLKPVQLQDIIRALARVRKSGKNLFVAEATIVNQRGEELAIARGTYYNQGQFCPES